MSQCPACHQTFERFRGGGPPSACPHCQSLVVGHYCDLVRIGGGAMGDVFQARRPDMGNRIVAIKLPKAADPHVCSRFEREIAASARLRHENIVCAFDRGEEEGRPYLVMEYVAGRVLGDVVDEEHPLSPARAARILLDVARGITHAAGRHIINRDIKPDNILLPADGGPAKILDYGLALIAELDGSSDRVTRSGSLLGTPGFLAPEQARDPRGVTPAADIYALGCTAYYLLTRRPPFSGLDSQELVRQHAEAPRPSVRLARPDISESFDTLIQRMMAVHPEERPSPRQVVEELERLLPTLSDERPVRVTRAAGGMIDVKCPGCGEVYHLRAESIGKSFQCRGNLCRKRFVIGPPEPERTLDASPQAGAAALDTPPAIGSGTPVGEPLLAEVAEAVVVGDEATCAFGPPPILKAEAVEPAGGELSAPPVAVLKAEIVEPEMLPLEAVVALPAEGPGLRDDGAPPVQIEQAEAVPPAEGASEHDSVEMLPAEAVVALPAAPPVQTPLAPGASLPAQPATAEVAAVPLGAVDEGRGRRGRPRGKRRARLVVWSTAAATLLVAMAGVLLLVLDPFNTALTPEERWTQIIDEHYKGERWSRAKREFEKFQEEFPDNPHVAEIPYFMAMCDAGEEIFSTTGNAEQGLERAKKIFEEHRDNPAYSAYCSDFYHALQQLVRNLVDKADKEKDQDKLKAAREAHELLATVGLAIDWEKAPARSGDGADSPPLAPPEELAEKIDKAQQKIELRLAEQDLLNKLKAAQSPEPVRDIDGMYASIDRLLDQFGELKKNRQIEKLREKAYEAEAARVRYVVPPEPELVPAAAAPPAARERTLVVVAGQPGAVTGEDQVVVGLSRGVLYVFNARGDFLWARRLGIDTQRLPARVEATASSPAALVATSSEDNTLVALEAATGRVLWQYRVADAGVDTETAMISAPLTVVSIPASTSTPARQWGLLPTTTLEGGGQIQVIELVLGKRLGYFDVGHPLSIGGAHDPETGLVYFPADSKRVFAIDPKAIEQAGELQQASATEAVGDQPEKPIPACRSVLLTHHASGSLRAPPVIVGKYLILAEASELEKMKLRAFEIGDGGFRKPEMAPLREQELSGWSWFAPRSAPDRITLVTDQGDLGVFGLNLDNSEEAIYPLVELKQKQTQGQRRELRQNPFRAVAVHADEHLLWVMTGGVLRKLSLDIFNQQVRTLWPKSDEQATLRGIPLHEPQMDRWGNLFFLATMSTDGTRYEFTAVESGKGTPLWKRHLGVNPSGDPIVVGEGVLLVDRSGRTIPIRPEEVSGTGAVRAIEPPAAATLPEGADPRSLMRLADERGEIYLAAPLEEGNRLALARLERSGAALAWQTVQLREPLQGEPCVLGKYLIAPCADGYLYRVGLVSEAGTLVNEQAFRWTGLDETRPGADHFAQVYPLGPEAVLLVNGGRLIRRLEFRANKQTPMWEEVGTAYDSTEELTDVLVAGGRGYASDAAGMLREFDLADPSRMSRRWSLGEPARELFVCGNRLLGLLGDRKLVCMTPGEAGQDQGPTWTTAAFKGPIRGRPLPAGDVLLVADSHKITGIRLGDGQTVWDERIRARVGPTAAAAPFGQGQMIVPLADGTLAVLPIPTPKQELAEARQ